MSIFDCPKQVYSYTNARATSTGTKTKKQEQKKTNNTCYMVCRVKLLKAEFGSQNISEILKCLLSNCAFKIVVLFNLDHVKGTV